MFVMIASVALTKAGMAKAGKAMAIVGMRRPWHAKSTRRVGSSLFWPARFLRASRYDTTEQDEGQRRETVCQLPHPRGTGSVQGCLSAPRLLLLRGGGGGGGGGGTGERQTGRGGVPTSAPHRDGISARMRVGPAPAASSRWGRRRMRHHVRRAGRAGAILTRRATSTTRVGCSVDDYGSGI